MTFYLVKPGLYGAVYIVTKVPRTAAAISFAFSRTAIRPLVVSLLPHRTG